MVVGIFPCYLSVHQLCLALKWATDSPDAHKINKEINTEGRQKQWLLLFIYFYCLYTLNTVYLYYYFWFGTWTVLVLLMLTIYTEGKPLVVVNDYKFAIQSSPISNPKTWLSVSSDDWLSLLQYFFLTQRSISCMNATKMWPIRCYFMVNIRELCM